MKEAYTILRSATHQSYLIQAHQTDPLQVKVWCIEKMIHKSCLKINYKG